MNTLVINGSPKGEKSDTLKITNAFLAGIKAEYRDSADIEVIDVSTADIGHCRGCFCCWTATPGKCVIHDDMDNILPAIINADIILWSFPLYYFGMPSKVKALLDRNLPALLPFMAARDDSACGHTARYNKKAADTVLISSAGLCDSVNNYEALIEQFNIMQGGTYAKIICPQAGLISQPELRCRIDEYLSYAEQAGREYALNRHFSDKTEAALNTLLYPPAVYMQMADASWDIKDETIQLTEADKNKNAAEKFTRQMAALYNPSAFDGADRVLEMYYTDADISFQLKMGKDTCEVRPSDFTAYTTRVETPLTVWQDISRGIYSGEQAMMEGKYRTFGDLKLLMSWNLYFGSGGNNSSEGQAAAADKKPEKKTNMTIMIATWFVIWLLLSINPVIGGIAGIAAVVCVHFASLKWELTVYDSITCLCVAAFSLCALFGFRMQILVPLSYLCFGLMWLFSCLTPVSLTAHYSKNEYNGDGALKNPLFLKTNYILTMAWGGLYLVTPIWTYFIMDSSVPYITAAVNSICPALMGLFTAWFQKWYPSRIARGGNHEKI